MKKALIMMMAAAALLAVSCSRYYTVEEILVEKEKIDQTQNPAKKFLIKYELQEEGILSKNMISLKDVLVKDIVPSMNIDYDFCVLADIETSKGKVECYIYTRNIGRIAKLEKGKTRIDARGQFGRFFTLLDEYYTKIEMVKSTITILNNK